MNRKPTPRSVRLALDAMEVPADFREPVVPTPSTVRSRTALHEPTEIDRRTVQIMAAGGIIHGDIAAARGISVPTLYKHYRQELDNGKTAIDTLALQSHVRLMEQHDFAAVKWWQQAKMGWRGEARDDQAGAQPTVVRIEYVGQPGSPKRAVTLDHAPQPEDDGLAALRKSVQLVG